jgi:hypothetical protein
MMCSASLVGGSSLSLVVDRSGTGAVVSTVLLDIAADVVVVAVLFLFYRVCLTYCLIERLTGSHKTIQRVFLAACALVALLEVAAKLSGSVFLHADLFRTSFLSLALAFAATCIPLYAMRVKKHLDSLDVELAGHTTLNTNPNNLTTPRRHTPLVERTGYDLNLVCAHSPRASFTAVTRRAVPFHAFHRPESLGAVPLRL